MPSIRNAGIPQLHGPYVVDYTDIAADGSTKVLWTPQIGDVLLALGTDQGSALDGQAGGVPENNGGILIGTVANPTLLSGSSGNYLGRTLSLPSSSLPYVFTTLSPVQVKYVALGDGDLTAGHSELYALVARALAP